MAIVGVSPAYLAGAQGCEPRLPLEGNPQARAFFWGSFHFSFLPEHQQLLPRFRFHAGGPLVSSARPDAAELSWRQRSGCHGTWERVSAEAKSERYISRFIRGNETCLKLAMCIFFKEVEPPSSHGTKVFDWL